MSSDGDKAVDGFDDPVRLFEVRWQAAPLVASRKRAFAARAAVKFLSVSDRDRQFAPPPLVRTYQENFATPPRLASYSTTFSLSCQSYYSGKVQIF